MQSKGVKQAVELLPGSLLIKPCFLIRKERQNNIMPLTGEDAETRYAHLLGKVGVHLTVTCPDCKHELTLMAQIGSTQLAQDKDDVQSAEHTNDSEIVLGVKKEETSFDSYELQSRLSDPLFILEEKRQRRKQMDEKKNAKLEQEFEEAFNAQQELNTARLQTLKEKNVEWPSSSSTDYLELKPAANRSPADNQLASPDKSSVTIDPTSARNTTNNPGFCLKPPPRKRRFELTLDTIDTVKAQDDNEKDLQDDCSSLSK